MICKILSRFLFSFLIFISGFACQSREKAENFSFESANMKVLAERLYDGEGTIWSMDFISPNQMIFSQRDGNLRILDLEKLSTIEVSDVPKVLHRGQGGLLDVMVDPDFAKNNRIYFCWSKAIGDKNTTALTRAKLAPPQKGKKTWALVEQQEIFAAEPALDSRHHFGCRIVMDQQRRIYLSIGERNQRDYAQALDSTLGKIVRITEDGKIPEDNPFVSTTNAKPAIWTLGHRNPQGLYIHPETQKIYENEHGPRGGDEINLIEKGKNYGWPVITYGEEYIGGSIGEGTHKDGMEQPLKYFVPSIAPSSLLIYSGRLFKAWKGDFFSGALVLTHINRIQFKNGKVAQEERLIKGKGWRVRDIVEDQLGHIYFSTDHGKIFRLKLRDQIEARR